MTVGHTVSGSNRLLLVGITLGSNTLQTRQATSVTWNGAALTLVGAVNHVTSPSRSRTEIWRLVAPTAGAYDVVVNLNGSLDSTGYQAVVSVMSFTGVDQTTPLGTYASSYGTAATQSVAISSAANELAFAVAGAQTQLLTNSGNTEYWNDNTMYRTFAAGGTKAGASSVTMTWTKGTTSIWTMSGVSIKPAAAATWAANEDTQITGLTKNTTRLALGFLVSNTGLLSSTASYKLQVAQTPTRGFGHLQRRHHQHERPLGHHGLSLLHQRRRHHQRVLGFDRPGRVHFPSGPDPGHERLDRNYQPQCGHVHGDRVRGPGYG